MVDAGRNLEIPNEWDRTGLPAWTYFSEELLQLEEEVLFRGHWQLACHLADLPDPGDYACFDLLGERTVVIRGQDGAVRAFHNVCRHRGSRVVVGERGRCGAAIVCPFHGWSYNLDGTLRGPARPKSLPDLDPVAFGLKPLDMETWMGFVFIRFRDSVQPSVGEVMAPMETEASAYNIPEMVPTDQRFWYNKIPVNWKAVRDVDNEGYHVPVAHPSLQDLYGRNYYDEPLVNGSTRSFGGFNEGAGRLWSVRHYKKILPEMANLPQSNRRAWVYLGLFPNTVIGLYPDSVMFYQEFPVGVGKTVQRGGTYRYKDESRELRLARYLSSRIDRVTGAEDTKLIIWSYEAAKSSGYAGIMLSDLEYGVRSYHDYLRTLLPVMSQDTEPAAGTVGSLNSELLLQHVA